MAKQFSGLQKDIKQFSFSQGIDTGTEQTVVPLGKLHSLENGYFKKDGKISKIPGRTTLPVRRIKSEDDDAGNNIPNFQKAFTQQDHLHAVSNSTGDLTLGRYYNDALNNIFSYSKKNLSWLYTDHAASVQASKNDIAISSESNNGFQSYINPVGSIAYANLYTCSVYFTFDDSTTSTFPQIVITESDTQNVVLSETLSSSTYNFFKVISNGNLFYVFYLEGTTIKCLIYDTTALEKAYPANSRNIVTVGVPANCHLFDAMVAQNNGYVYIAYKNAGTTITVKALSILTLATQTIVYSNDIANTPINYLHIFGGESTYQKIYVGYGRTAVGSIIAYLPMNLSAATTVTVNATIAQTFVAADTVYTGDSSSFIPGFLEFKKTTVPAQQQAVILVTISNTTITAYPTFAGTYYNAFIGSKPIVVDNKIFLVLLNNNYDSSSYFLMQAMLGTYLSVDMFMVPIARINYSESGQNPTYGNETGCYISRLAIKGTLGTDCKLFFLGFTATETRGSLSLGFYRLYQPSIIEFDFDYQLKFQSVEFENKNYFNGGYIACLDSNEFIEASPLVDPKTPVVTGQGTSGSLTPLGSYAYVVVYRFIDSNGNYHDSPPSLPVLTTLTGANDEVFIEFDGPNFSRLPYMEVLLYRTEANGNIYYLEYRTTVPTNGETVPTYNSRLSDADLIVNEILYTTGDVLENQNIDSPIMLTVWRERLFALTASGVFFSKKVTVGYPASFNSLLTLNTVIGKSPPTGIAALKDKFIVFYENEIYYIAGDGPNDIGQGSFSSLELVSSGVGCTNPNSIVEADGLVFFQSKDGIRALDASLNIQYIGLELDHYITDSNQIRYGTYHDTLHQIRFGDTNRAYVYDKITQQWSTHLFNDTYQVPWEDTIVHVNPTYLSYDDPTVDFKVAGDPYSLRVRTGWINLIPIEGYQRLYRAIILARYRSPHNVVVSVFYDGVPALMEQFTITPSLTVVSDYSEANVYENDSYGGLSERAYEIEIKPKLQKCTSVRFEIHDENQSDSCESFELIGINLVLGLKNVGTKLQATSRAAPL